MNKQWFILIALLLVVSGCTSPSSHPSAKGAGKPTGNGVIRPLSTQTPQLVGGNEIDNRKEAEPLTLEQLRKKYPSNFIFESPDPTENEVALTFDDVPDQWFTLQVLDILKQHDVKATFFVVGNRSEDNPDVIARIVKDGHVLGNHSYTHANFPKISDDAFHEEVLKTQEVIRKLTGGHRMRYIRPPYGNISEDQIKWLVSQHLKVVNWNVDSLDWKGLSADEVEANIMSQVKPGSIILQHGAGGTGEDLNGTVQALPRVIKQLRERGMKFVTLSEMLDEDEWESK